MSGEAMGGEQPTVIPLRDGSELRVDAEGLHVGEALYRLEQIQDARQVSPEPATIGLRVDGVGLVTLIPARPGDATVALEALFRLRPDLRPAGFAPPGMPPAGAWPYGAAPGYAPPPWYPAPPYGLPPQYPPPYPPGPPAPGYGFAPPPPGYGYPPPYPGYAIVPPMPGQPGGTQGADPYGGPNRPGVGPWPQGIGDVLGTIFRLFFRNFWRLALLGLAVALVPALLRGGMSVAIDVAEGLDPTQGILGQRMFRVGATPNAPLFPWIQQPPSPGQIALAVGIGLLALVVFVVLGAWETASLAVGARELVRGQPVRIGGALRGGLRRLPRVLGTMILLALMVIALVVVMWIALILMFAVGAGLFAATGRDAGSGPAAILLVFGLELVIFVGVLVLLVYFRVRLSLAVYAAACDGLSPGKAIGRSWTLTRANWWRTFIPTLVIGFVVGLVVGSATRIELVSLIGLYLVAIPLLSAVSAPLSAMTAVVIYYDLRLRREGFPPVASELGLPGFGGAPAGPTMRDGPGAGPDGTGGPTQSGQPALHS